MITGYHTYATAQSLAFYEGSSPAIYTRSIFMELVKHINQIGSIISISWITSELLGKYL